MHAWYVQVCVCVQKANSCSVIALAIELYITPVLKHTIFLRVGVGFFSVQAGVHERPLLVASEAPRMISKCMNVSKATINCYYVLANFITIMMGNSLVSLS